MNNTHHSKKRIDQILLEKGFAESRNKARAMIMAGQVYCEEKLINKSSELFNYNENIKIINNDEKWVSRGALKLEPVIINQQIKVKNKICLDIGSSTGGFTQVLLKHGARKIYAVDVGYGQLHEKIKLNNKVNSLERKNARYLTSKDINEEIDLIVCDTSFISLKKVINKPIEFLKKNGNILALIKPQFEASKSEIKRGVVKDPLVHRRICEDISTWFLKEKKYKFSKIIESSIKGPKGNIEFFIFVT